MEELKSRWFQLIQDLVMPEIPFKYTYRVVITTNMRRSFQVKSIDEMHQVVDTLPPTESVDFVHVDFNVRKLRKEVTEKSEQLFSDVAQTFKNKF